MMKTVLISDLHLSCSEPDRLTLFINFIREEQNIDKLFILGDFFDHWIGDDIGIPAYRAVISALAEFNTPERRTYVMLGNRDFLLGNAFSEEAKVILIHDPHITTIANKKVVLTHGDTLCTDDTQYLRYRRIVRKAWFQKLFLALPQAARKYIGQSMRNTSQKKNQFIKMDVSHKAVEAMVQAFGATCIIHGHTHRPSIHWFKTEGQRNFIEHFVLSDWEEQGHALEFDGNSSCRMNFF